MKKKYIILAVIVIFLGIFAYSSFSNVKPVEIDNSPDWVALQDAQNMAMESDKLIFVDVYEVGCKFCRAMDREVFPDSTVRAVLDRGYIPVKLDGNSPEMVSFDNTEVPSKAFAQSKGAFAFPTALILDENGNVLKKRTGFMNVDEFRTFLYR